MSRLTPRKSRHRQQAGGGGRALATSDYESDAALPVAPQLPETVAPSSSNPPRDNNDLNYRVLRRYLPNMRSILAISANTVVYNFVAGEQNWEKSGLEGTMFVVEMEPFTIGQTLLPQARLFILNRRGLDNFQIDLARTTDCEDVSELVIFRTEDDQDVGADAGGEENETEKKVVGLWIHPDPKSGRDGTASTILEWWRRCRGALVELTTSAENTTVDADPGPAAQPIQSNTSGDVSQLGGRRLSITDLFGPRNGNS